MSFFAVSPDDKHIAVAVEDLSSSDSINLRLYVEDLIGGGHHAEIYSTTVAKQGGNILWPMGWRQGLLVLAVMAACDPYLSSLSPVAWHVVDPANGDRKYAVIGYGCTLSRWPSPTGETCTVNGRTDVYNWLGGVIWTLSNWNNGTDPQSGLSPSGQRVFISGNGVTQCTTGEAGTCIIVGAGTSTDPRIYAMAVKHYGCLWIDEDHVLAPDAIIEMPSKQFPDSRYVPVIPLGHSGTCAGRFPGGL